MRTTVLPSVAIPDRWPPTLTVEVTGPFLWAAWATAAAVTLAAAAGLWTALEVRHTGESLRAAVHYEGDRAAAREAEGREATHAEER